MSLLLLLMSATIGFLWFNLRHPWRRCAEVFMGDAGSMMLGAAVAFFMIRISADAGSGVPFIAMLWLVIIPAIDTVSLVVRRLAAGHSPLAADRQHLHHLLLDAGLSPAAVAGMIVAVSFALGGFGLAAAALGAPVILHVSGMLGVLALHTWFVLPRPKASAGKLKAEPPPSVMP